MASALEQADQRHLKSASDDEQVCVLRIPDRVLVALDAPTLQPDEVGEVILREAGCAAGLGDAAAERRLLLEDPCGSGGTASGHSTNR